MAGQGQRKTSNTPRRTEKACDLLASGCPLVARLLTTLVFKPPAILLYDAALQFLPGFGRNGRGRRSQGSSPSSAALDQKSTFWACCCTSTLLQVLSDTPSFLCLSFCYRMSLRQMALPSGCWSFITSCPAAVREPGFLLL